MIISLYGGLGNQMFQYAFAKKMESFGYDVALEASWFNNNKNTSFIFNINDNHTHKTIRNLEIESYELDLPILKDFSKAKFFSQHDKFYNFKRKINKFLPKPLRFKEYKFYQNDDMNLYEMLKKCDERWDSKRNLGQDSLQNIESKNHIFNENSYFDGVYQSMEHILINGKIFSDFKLKNPLSKRNEEIKEKIKTTQDSVFLHIRRGDYLGLERYIHLKINYYNAALEIIKSHLQNPNIFIFSNDMKWCKENFLQQLDSKNDNIENYKITESRLFNSYNINNTNFHFIDNNDEGNAISDMELMRSCKHAIIANSTFSLWAAYLIDSVNINSTFIDSTLKNSILRNSILRNSILRNSILRNSAPLDSKMQNSNLESSKIIESNIIIAPSRFLKDSTPSRMRMLYPNSWLTIEV